MSAPAGVTADLTRAMELWHRGERLEAEREIERLLRDSPEDPKALRSLAEIYAGSGRASQSISLWRRLVQLCPADAGILRQLAQALLADHSTAEAIDVLRAAIALEPTNPRAYNNLSGRFNWTHTCRKRGLISAICLS